MTHPHNDPELQAIVGLRPHPDAVWCDECCRWEGGFGKHKQPKLCPEARRLQKVASELATLLGKVSRQALLVQARHLVDKGQGFSK